MVTLIDTLNGIKKMSDELIQQLYNIVTDKLFKKGDFMLRAGEVCQNIYYDPGLQPAGATEMAIHAVRRPEPF